MVLDWLIGALNARLFWVFQFAICSIPWYVVFHLGRIHEAVPWVLFVCLSKKSVSQQKGFRKLYCNDTRSGEEPSARRRWRAWSQRAGGKDGVLWKLSLRLMGRTKGTCNGIFFRWVGRFDSVCKILLFLDRCFLVLLERTNYIFLCMLSLKNGNTFMHVTVKMVIKIY
jgi:hypothetical protein